MVIAKGQPMLAQDIIDMDNRLQMNIDNLGRITILPVGTILMYDGNGWTDNSTLPGWYRCDAANAAAGRTPDLTDKFIMGSTVSGNTGGTAGGSNSVTLTTGNLPAHNHTLSVLTIGEAGAHGHTVTGTVVSGGAHTHPVTGTVDSSGTHAHGVTDPGHAHGYAATSGELDNPYNINGVRFGIYDARTTGRSGTGISIANDGAHDHNFSSGSATSAGAHGHTFSSGSAANVSAHTHSISGGTIGNTGSGAAFDNRPSYYALIYIRKCV
jgi:microcystin-dependent protein